MSVPRFHQPDLGGDIITLDPAEARHAHASLRLRPGDEVELFDGRGGVARGRVFSPTDDPTQPRKRLRRSESQSLTVRIEQRHQTLAGSNELHLIVAACKGDRLRWMVEKCTELGVTRLVFAEFERSVVQPREAHADKLERYAIEACKQCGRNWLPRFDAGGSLLERAGELESAELLVAHPEPSAPTLANWIAAHSDSPRTVAVVIGPEGGLTDDELHALHGRGAQTVRLAEHILRIETAAIAVAAVFAQYAFGVVGHFDSAASKNLITSPSVQA